MNFYKGKLHINRKELKMKKILNNKRIGYVIIAILGAYFIYKIIITLLSIKNPEFLEENYLHYFIYNVGADLIATVTFVIDYIRSRNHNSGNSWVCSMGRNLMNVLGTFFCLPEFQTLEIIQKNKRVWEFPVENHLIKQHRVSEKIGL